MSHATREDWRRWTRRGLVSKPKGPYAWIHVLQALALSQLERVANPDIALRCWDDFREELVSTLPRKVMDLIVDPGMSPASRPHMRAYLSFDDETTLERVRAAEQPYVVALGPLVADARAEFDHVTRRTTDHAAATAAPKTDARKARGWR